MGGETEAEVSGWTVDTLRSDIVGRINEADRRYEQRFDAQEKAVTAALEAARQATEKAERADEKRFEGVNEFRDQLKDQAATFITRTEVEALIRGLVDKTDLNTTRITNIEGRTSGGAQVWGAVVAAALVVIGLAGVIIATIAH